VTAQLSEGYCRSCHAVVKWARTRATGKRMPLDVEPDWKRGNVLLDEERRAVVLPSPEAARQSLLAMGGKWDGPYLSHFASCPQAVVHRRVA